MAVGTVADAERAQIEKIKANVADGAPDGLGVVLLKTESSNLCLAVGGKVPSHRQLLLRDEDKLNLEMQTKVVIKDTNIDDAFLNIQKRQCGAVYASAADLKTLTAALAHDDIPYAFPSLWNLPTDVERQDAELAEKARIAAKEETERAQRNADQSRLASKRAEDLSATQAAQQVALRQKFGDSAKAAADALSSEIVTWTRDPWTKDDQKRQIAIVYPAFAAWLTDKLADHWEIMTIDTEVHDFGTSSFKSRALDTILPGSPSIWKIGCLENIRTSALFLAASTTPNFRCRESPFTPNATTGLRSARGKTGISSRVSGSRRTERTQERAGAADSKRQAKFVSRQRSSKRMLLTWMAARLARRKCALIVARANLFATEALVSPNPYCLRRSANSS
jgi:hypothetical protein